MTPNSERQEQEVTWYARAFVLLQYVLPKLLLTRIVHRVSRVRIRAFKDFLIERFVKLYDIELEDVELQVPEGFSSLNDFFTRPLAADARPIDRDPATLVSPVDGTLSACGGIERDSLYQAKGKTYSLAELLATDLHESEDFIDGSFATIYLAPYNYHRVHAPLAGRLLSLRHIPGTLFSVNGATARGIPKLFCRNERLVLRMETDVGTLAVVFVGALNVGSITTPWTGELRPSADGVARELALPSSDSRVVAKGDLLGWFNMGSTVIVLMPPSEMTWTSDVAAGSPCRVGEAMGRLGQST